MRGLQEHPVMTPTQDKALDGVPQVNLYQMTRDERIAFFINIYNALVVHAMALFGPAETTLKRCE